MKRNHGNSMQYIPYNFTTLSVVGVAGELYPRERKKFWGAHSLV